LAASATSVENARWQLADFTGRLAPLPVRILLIAIGVQYMPRAATVA
jgi:hypothetical protein